MLSRVGYCLLGLVVAVMGCGISGSMFSRDLTGDDFYRLFDYAFRLPRFLENGIEAVVFILSVFLAMFGFFCAAAALFFSDSNSPKGVELEAERGK